MSESDFMPQPLSKIRLKGPVSIMVGGPGAFVIDSRSEVTSLAMAVIAAWSHAEYEMMQIFAFLAGGAQTDAGAVYFSLEQKGAKANAINVLADRKLDPTNRGLLRAIMGIAKERQAKRDKLAHWIWGSSPQLPDAILLCNPLDMSKAGGGIPSWDDIFVYDTAEFKRLRKEMEQVGDWAGTYLLVIMGHPANRNNRLFDQLCKEPEIAARLTRQERAR
jgi:hypothetical protein